MRGTLEGHGTYGGRGEGEGPGTTPVCPQCDKKSKPNPVPVRQGMGRTQAWPLRGPPWRALA